MGRKAAPQPLALQSDPALRSDDPPTAETTSINNTISTFTSQGVSPAASKSPRSPLSPFHSRFSPLRSQNRHKTSPVAAVTPATAAAAKGETSRQVPAFEPTYDQDTPSLYSTLSSAFEPPPRSVSGPPPSSVNTNTNTNTNISNKANTNTNTNISNKANTNTNTNISNKANTNTNTNISNKANTNTNTNISNKANTNAKNNNTTAVAPTNTTTTTTTTTTATNTTTTPTASSTKPKQPVSPPPSQPESKKGTKNGFFHFSKPSKSFSNSQSHAHHRKETESRNQIMSRGTDGSSRPRHGDRSNSDHTLNKPTSAEPLRSDLSVSSAGDQDTASPQSTKKAKSKGFGRLHRSRSNRDKEGASPELKPIPVPHAPPQTYGNEPELHLNSVPLKTAPLNPDRSFRDMMGSSVRNRSEDRTPTRDSSTTREHREKESKTQPSSLRDTGGSTFLSGLKNSSTRAADIFSKGFFGKSGRSGASEKDAIDDENYQLKVINLPLVEQARLTRISKRLEDSRDKTEFWMPAFPWRAIDYLNYKGCEVEGLYRVPGSGPQIKKYQRKFDEHYDVNLFEEEDLYDINIIGSMLKAWLRELPDEIFPKAAQERVSRECAGAEEVPELLIEELSNLSPFNYYLLFAITCHLSLLLAHSDKNKMDFRNLCICFQPCMRIDAFCFKFLVCDWRDCWRGCKNEGFYIEEEYMLFDQPPPRGIAESQKPKPQESDTDRQQLSSSDSSKISGLGQSESKSRLKKKPLQLSASNGSVASNKSTPSLRTKVTFGTELDREPARGPGDRDMRPLSPIKPLSPLGF